MNQAHLHLLVNHFPIIGSYLTLLVLVFGYLLKNQTVKITGLGLFVVSTLFAIAAFITGDEAEHLMKASRLVNLDFVEKHEELAESCIWFFYFTGFLALVAMIASIRKTRIARTLTFIVTLLVGGVSFAMMKVGNSGGEIRHTEIRSVNTPQNHEEEHED